MEKRKLKPFVMPMIYGIACAAIIMSLVLLDKVQNEKVLKDDSNYTYVNGSIFKNDISFIQEEKIIIKPYISDKVQILKKYYDIEGSKEDRQNAIIYYNDTYMQNSGILYMSQESFDVISVLDGTVVDIKKDDVLGNVVEIKHSNNLISTYEGLNTINVKKDQLVKQGDVIGKSGKLQISEQVENGLLFELIYNGKMVNPEKYFDKKVNDL